MATATDGLTVGAMLEVLRAHRTAVDDAIAALEKLESLGGLKIPVGGKLGGGSIKDIAPDTFFGLNAAEAAKKYLRLCRKAQSVDQILEALTTGGLQVSKESLFTILPRAAKGREIVRVGRAMWGLSEWYPGKQNRRGSSES